MEEASEAPPLADARVNPHAGAPSHPPGGPMSFTAGPHVLAGRAIPTLLLPPNLPDRRDQAPEAADFDFDSRVHPEQNPNPPRPPPGVNPRDPADRRDQAPAAAADSNSDTAAAAAPAATAANSQRAVADPPPASPPVLDSTPRAATDSLLAPRPAQPTLHALHRDPHRIAPRLDPLTFSALYRDPHRSVDGAASDKQLREPHAPHTLHALDGDPHRNVSEKHLRDTHASVEVASSVFIPPPHRDPHRSVSEKQLRDPHASIEGESSVFIPPPHRDPHRSVSEKQPRDPHASVEGASSVSIPPRNGAAEAQRARARLALESAWAAEGSRAEDRGSACGYAG